MFLKINEMRKCHPHQGFWRRGEVGDFASRDAGEANPRGLTHAVAIRYKDSGTSEPNPVIFRGIYRLQLKSRRFSLNLNAGSGARSRIRSLESFDAPSRPSINGLAKSHRPKVAARGGTRAPSNAWGGIPVQRPRTSRLPLEVRSDTCLTIPSHHIIESSTLKK